MTTTQNLMRSRGDTLIAGVAGGIARYLSVDPVLVRIAFVLLLFSGPGLFIYLLLWLVMPQEPMPTTGVAQPGGQVFVAEGTPTQRLRIDPQPGPDGDEIPIQNLGGGQAMGGPIQRPQLVGWVLIGLGAFITLQMIWPGAGAILFPAALIGAGVWLVRRIPQIH